jgi:hypothetical protein
MPWTPEQVLALAPDAGSAKAGKDLAAARKWRTLGSTDVCAWGTIQGSGRDPYQTSIDLSGPAFKCSCPSRKFPCKHGLGLFLIWAQQPEAFSDKNPPAWTTEWLTKRIEKEEKKTAHAAPTAADAEPAADPKAGGSAGRRAAAREARVTAGLGELRVWLNDLVRSGFAVLPGKPSSYWEGPAARLVDSQAPGLARRLRALDGITTRGEGWEARLLLEAGLLHLAAEGWSRIASLPAETQADLRSILGFTTSQEEVLAGAGVRDSWFVIGQRIEEEDRLRTQRTWLFGVDSGRPALCLSFSASPSQPLDMSLIPGTTVDAEMAFFPTAWPLRALVKRRDGSPRSDLPAFPHASLAEACAFAASALTANPWLERVPFALTAVTPLQRPHGWGVRDGAGAAVALNASEQQAWVLSALAGGGCVALTGEWDGEALTPLGIVAEGRFLRV